MIKDEKNDKYVKILKNVSNTIKKFNSEFMYNKKNI